MAEPDGRRKATDNQHAASSAVQLADLGIPKTRASRVMQLAEVPQDQFDTASAQPEVAQPKPGDRSAGGFDLYRRPSKKCDGSQRRGAREGRALSPLRIRHEAAP